MTTSPRARGHLLRLCLSLALAPCATAQQTDREVLVNGGFDLDADENGIPDGWNVSLDRVLYREQVAFGRDFEIVSKPGQYVLATQPVKLTPGEVYTIILEARGSGGGTAGALIVHGQDRPQREMALIWRQRVTEEYATYARSFTAPNPVASLYLYNVAKVGEVAYRKVSLLRGTPDFPLVREVYFGDQMEPDEPPLETPHTPWAKPLAGGPLKTLFSVYSFRSIREHLELADRLDLDYDLLYTGNEPGEASSPTGRRAQQRLIEHQYDVMVLANRIPEAFQKQVQGELERGVGLVVVEGFGRSRGLFDPKSLPELAADHYLKRDLPWSTQGPDLPREIRAGTIGKSRVVWLHYPTETTRVWGIQPVLTSQEDYRHRTLRYWEYQQAFLARCLAWAGGRDTATTAKATSNGDGVTVTVTGAPAGAKVELTWRSDREIRFGRPDLSFKSVSLPASGGKVAWPPDFPGGAGVADLRLLDADGKVLYWAGLEVARPRPAALGEVTPAATVLEPGQPVEVKLTAPQGKLEATLTDAYGRTYASATSAQPNATLKLDTAKTCSTGNKLTVRLLDDLGWELDSQWHDIFIPKLNRQQAWDDFHVTAWGDGYTNPVVSHGYNLLMRQLGFNGKFASFPYGSNEDGLWPSQSAGSRGFFPSGKRNPEHTRAAGCLSDPAFYAKNDESWNERIPAHHAYGIVAWSIGDEISITNRHEVDEVDWSPQSLESYHQWLAGKYPSIAALNAEWGTAYGSFDEAQPALTEDVRGSTNFAPFCNFRTFMTDEWVKALTYASKHIGALDPEAKVGHTNTFGCYPFNGADYAKICTLPGFTWGQEYSEAIKGQAQKAVYQFWRSFCPEDMPNLGWIGYDHRSEAVKYEPWWLALNGSRGVSYYATNAAAPERGTSWALIHPTQQLSPYSRGVQAALHDLVNGCGKALMETAEVPPEVAILWSHPSLLASWCESGATKPVPTDVPPFDAWGAYFRSALNLRLQLEALGLSYRYVSPQQLAADPNALKPYKLVCLPFTSACDAATVDRLVAYAKAGGTVLGDLNCLRYDEHGKARDDSPQLAKLFGVKRSGQVTYQETDLDGVPGYGHEALEIVEGTARRQHADGAPAEIVRTTGQGRTIYLNWMLLSDDTPTMDWLGKLLATEAKLTPPITLTRTDSDAPAAVQLVRRRNGPVELVGISRDHRRVPKDETDPAKLTLNWGKPRWITDLRSGKQLGQTDHLEVALGAGDAGLWALLPYQTQKLALTVPAKVTRGTALALTAAVQTTAKPGRHVLHLELKAPDGSVRPCYAKNVAAPDGRWQGDLPLALNDPAGRWTLTMHDVIGGVSAAQNFEVE